MAPVRTSSDLREASDKVPRRLAAGDGLRAIASMSVLVFHAAIATLLFTIGTGSVNGEGTAGQFEPIFGFLSPVFVNLRAGIYIFFALSGYLLTRPFLWSYLAETPMPRVLRYFRNRALRIIPAFWVVTTAYLIWEHGRPGGGVGGTLAVYGFAQNYYNTASANLLGQAWTLDIEIGFYVMIPVAALLAAVAAKRITTSPRTRLVGVLTLLLAGFAGSLVLRHHAGNPLDLSYTPFDFLFAFIPGVALAAIEPFVAPRLHGARAGRAWAGALALLCLALLTAFVALPVSDYGLRSLVIALGCGAMVATPLIYQWTTGGCWRWLDNGVMRWLGERSYGIYLIHLGLMNHILSRIGHGHSVKTTFVLLLIASTVLTLIAADILWRVVELPALHRRLPWRRRQPSAAVPAASPAQAPAPAQP